MWVVSGELRVEGAKGQFNDLRSGRITSLTQLENFANIFRNF